MILSDREARAACGRRVIWVSDCPPAGNKRWSSTTLDLTLAEEVRPWLPQSGPGVAECSSVLLKLHPDLHPAGR